MHPRTFVIRGCPTCDQLIAEREEPLSERDDHVRCPWCASTFWVKTGSHVATIWPADPSLTALFDQVRPAEATSIREVFDALFPDVPLRAEGWLARAIREIREPPASKLGGKPPAPPGVNAQQVTVLMTRKGAK